jgi:isocitrate dehydrogenase kinase/phosphatase
VRGRFSEVIARQLDLFEEQDAEFLRRVDEAERAYDDADRDDAEEVFGRYQELVEHGTEALGEMRDAYAGMLEDDDAEEYAAEFNQAVIDRLPRFGLEIEDV